MDKETRQMFELILKKLDGLETRFESMETRQESMETRFDVMETRQESMGKRQDEMYLLFRSLEENVKVTRAEQEKATYVLADMQGKLTKLTEKVEDHETVIEQIRAIN
ncbi:hypothetical protein [Clostridium pasteurianum]|uniref:Uncharacterized protein n=1 Tax=Clostridium pasteurianum BC1 TaxID=86416 RepID=R4K909_CLOPA|nr:hypothetical protein [Clostridium pasteurianum]AGK98201.1 hypothetical protein Clopa_3407 [Clostridium pasteurianum BC1]